MSIEEKPVSQQLQTSAKLGKKSNFVMILLKVEGKYRRKKQFCHASTKSRRKVEGKSNFVMVLLEVEGK